MILKRVMVIDDNEIDQRAYRRVLQRSGVIGEVLPFLFADEALQYLKANPHVGIDVIFLDIHLPRMNGLEFLETAQREIGDGIANMVALLLTTSLRPSDRRLALRYPIVRETVKKPLTVEDVRHVAMMATGAEVVAA